MYGRERKEKGIAILISIEERTINFPLRSKA